MGLQTTIESGPRCDGRSPTAADGDRQHGLVQIDLVSFIVVAQALTVLCFPILAAVLVWQLHSLHRVPLLLRLIVWCGLLVVIGLATRTIWSFVG